MESILIIIIIGMVGIAIGFAIAKVMEKKNASKIVKGARKIASTTIREAKICLLYTSDAADE